LITVTKNADQPLALWRMVKKFAFEQSGVAPQTTRSDAKMLIYTTAVLSATVVWLFGGYAA